MIKKIYFIACDSIKIKEVKNIIRKTQIKNLNIGYKFGLGFFYSKKGRDFVSKIDKSKIVFLDLKLNDIPNTCISAVKALKDFKNINYLTVHISGGYEMLKAVKKTAKKINKNIKVIGVTVLTSFTDKSFKKIGHTKKIKSIVIKQSKLAKAAGLDGVVCSPLEAKLIKNICKNMEIITPGIRLSGDKSQDQKRIMTPNEAFKNGATSIVMGRSIIKGNIKNNLRRLINSIK